MKKYNKKLWILVTSAIFLFTSCDWMLPHKIAGKTDGYQVEDEDYGFSYEDEKPEYNSTTQYSEHNSGEMTLYEFYSERYFSNGENNPDRFLSKRLETALNGISDLERKTGYIILDSDPFINSQDRCFNESQMSFERIGSSDCYTFSNGRTNVTLYMIEDNGKYYIDDILLPSGILITELYEKEK